MAFDVLTFENFTVESIEAFDKSNDNYPVHS
jgi:hypothetical protein